MAALESASLSVFSSLSLSSSSKFLASTKPSPNLKISRSAHSLSLNFSLSLHRLSNPKTNPYSVLCTAVQEAATEDDSTSDTDQSEEPNLKRKLFVVNLPWSLTVVDIRTLFSECGGVDDVEIIKQKNGKSRGFAFVTMSSGEEAQAVVDKFDSQEVSGRIIRVELAKRMKKPLPPRSTGIRAGEAIHKLYASNLAWKAKSKDLKDFFSPDFSPVSARVIFEHPTGRSAGYGFVSFETREEAEAAVSALHGKPLMDRPVSLQMTDDDAGESEDKDEDSSESQPSES